MGEIREIRRGAVREPMAAIDAVREMDPAEWAKLAPFLRDPSSAFGRVLATMGEPDRVGAFMATGEPSAEIRRFRRSWQSVLAFAQNEDAYLPLDTSFLAMRGVVDLAEAVVADVPHRGIRFPVNAAERELLVQALPTIESGWRARLERRVEWLAEDLAARSSDRWSAPDASSTGARLSFGR